MAATKAKAKTANDKKADDDATKLDAPAGADLGEAEAVPPPEDPDPIERVDIGDKTPDEAGYELADANTPDAVLLIGRDSTKPEGQNEQAAYAVKKGD
jgi:hypothetical protein